MRHVNGLSHTKLHRWRLRLLNLKFVCVTFICLGAQAGDWLAVTENFPPYNFTENGQPRGYATELVYKLATQVGIDVDVQVLPWSRAMLTAQERPNVLIFSMLRTPDREHNYHWIGAIDDMSIYIWQLKGNPKLVNKTIGQITYATSRSLDELNTTMLVDRIGAAASNVIAVETTEQLMGMLLKGRVDRVVLAENIWRQVRSKLDQAEIQNIERVSLLVERQLFVAASLQTELGKVSELKLAFEKISGAPSLLALREQHGLN